jgi:hypothetical protein
MVKLFTGMTFTEEIDLKMEFENSPEKYILNDWALVQFDHNAQQWNSNTNTTDTVSKAIQTIYLKNVSRTSRPLQWMDGMAVVGGFYIFVRAFFGFFIYKVNERFLSTQLFTDLYTIHKNRDYLDISDTSTKPKNNDNKKPKVKKPVKKESEEEEEYE